MYTNSLSDLCFLMFFFIIDFSLGPPDYYPQTSNCPEETLTREYLQVGYKEIVEGIEVCSLLCHVFCTELGSACRGIWSTAVDIYLFCLLHFLDIFNLSSFLLFELSYVGALYA